MKLSYSWLKELTKTALSPEKLAELLNLQVAAVENVKKMGEGLDKIIVAEVLEIKKHPQADKLQVVKVATKQFSSKAIEQFNIVCGAFNYKVGDKVPLALPGAVLPNGAKITESVIRGIKSFGMLCAEDELGLGEDHQGILILNKSSKTGEKLSKTLGLDDFIIDIETVAITHRPDLFGHIGFAREIAVLTGKKLTLNHAGFRVTQHPTWCRVKIKIENYVDCPRYMGVVIDGIKIAPSPVWMQNRLRSLGVRPINNIVDITNYVMLEVGQPLHAFDFNGIADIRRKDADTRRIQRKSALSQRQSAVIAVRRARPGEKLLCLDGIERKLDNDILVIADNQKPIALAGIMGGEYSGITEKTKTIVIESANFNPTVIRKGAKKMGIRTEANTRFEKNLPVVFTEEGLKLAIELIEKIAGGKVVSQIYDAKDKKTEKTLKIKKIINLELDKISDLIGIKIPETQIIKYLKALGFTVKKTSRLLRTAVPVHRNDIEYPEDIIEEIARIYGYQKIEPQPIKADLEVIKPDPSLKLERNLKNILVGLGFDELYNYSFYSEKIINSFKLKKEEHLEVANPLNPDQQYLRVSLLPKLLEKASENNPLFENFRIFEIGKIYRFSPTNYESKRITNEVEESKYMSGLILEKNKKMFFLTKGMVETILEKIGINKNQISYQSSQNQNYQYLDNFTGIMFNNEAIGLFGLIKKQIRDNLKITADVGIFEINLEKLVKLDINDKIFEKISTYPPIIRDLALITPKNIVFDEVYRAIKKFNSLILSVEPFDVFESEKLGANVRSVAFHLTFQSFERTLVSGEVDKIINDLVRTLEQKFSAKLRNF